MATVSFPSPNPTHLIPTYHARRRGPTHLPFPRATPLRPVSATKLPSRPPPASPGELYQPFLPPPSPLPPQYRNLNPVDRLDVLRNRLGLWFEYALLIPSLSQDGFTPSSVEEVTGITGVEQSRLVVGAQVRDSLVSSAFDADLLAYFDVGGAELLYELRFLNATQRAAAARKVVEDRLDARGTRELARAIKDFRMRRGDEGWEDFSGESPADCLAYTYFRLSWEAISDADRRAALERAAEAVETEAARRRVEAELEKRAGEGGGREGGAEVGSLRVPVVRMKYGEVAEATSVVVLPVCEAGDGEEGVAAAPVCRAEGEFGVVTAESEWKRWVVLPRWTPLAGMGEGGSGVVVAFPDARVLPWRTNRWEKEEKLLVVADRGRREVAEPEGFYLVSRVSGTGGGRGGLAVERGSRLLELEVKTAQGAVVLVVRPPREDVDDQLRDEEWD